MLRPNTATASLIAVALLTGALGWRLIVTLQLSSAGAHPSRTVSPHLMPSSHEPSDQDRIASAFQSALNNELHGLEKALDSGLEIDVRNAEGMTLLMSLAKRGRRGELIRRLLERGADTGLTDRNGWTALVWAA